MLVNFMSTDDIASKEIVDGTFWYDKVREELYLDFDGDRHNLTTPVGGGWPINGLYLSYDNISPVERFGGTWELITSGDILAVANGENAGESFTIRTDGVAIMQQEHTVRYVSVWRRVA